jgi:GR25 family glycosyltransferase involved in LPS biosynthesis
MYNFCTDTSYSGMGAYFRSIMAWFLKDKWKYLSTLQGISIQLCIAKNFYRKTSRSLIEPVRFKGWKGGR